MRSRFGWLSGLAARFMRARNANIATIFALSIVPMTIAAGTGVDVARGMVVRTRLGEALDAAALAVGASPNMSQSDMEALAQKYFNANYSMDTSLGSPSAVTVVKSGQTITVSSSVPMPTTWMKIAGIKTYTVTNSSQVVWGQTKLWVALALDNTGSMSQTDSTGTSKISALKTATKQLLTTLQKAAAKDGDVEVAIVPFSKTVNVGTSNASASWIDWTDWEAAPPSSTPSSSVGPGSSCPYSSWSNGYSCQKTPTNGSSTTSTVPSSGTYSGYICPSIDSGSNNSNHRNRYYNGCYNSVPTTSTSTNTSSNTSTVCSNKSSCKTTTYCSGYPSTSTSTSGNTTTVSTTTCECHSSGSGSKQTCTRTTADVATTTTTGAPYTHSWIVNDHSTWSGCIMDRDQDYDIQNTTPTSTASTKFPAENSTSCVPSKLGTLSYDWTSLSNQVDAMSAGGSTNQTIGLVWAWQALTSGVPLSAGTLPADTKQVIILLSDGLNTQNRWDGDGSNQSSAVDARMSKVCANVKAANIIVYTVFVDLNGTSGNSAVLESCASDSTKYFDLTTSGAIITAFDQIATEITNLRVAK
ncbi:MAG: hypothetical protein GC166_12435 [Alphaproteobacteria bacterium]|nr:hypothetical protein [Alphaproteobacteria bacterium]